MKDKVSPVQINVIKVPRHQLLKHQHHRKIPTHVSVHHEKSRSKQSSNVRIHTKRPKIVTNSVCVSTIHRQRRSLTQSIRDELSNISSVNNLQKESVLSTNQNFNVNQGSQMANYQNFIIDHDQSHIKDRTDVTKNHHKKFKKKKKNCLRRCILFSALIIALIIAIILSILLIKFHKTTKGEITKEAVLRWNPIGITVAGISNVSGNDDIHLNTPWDVTLDYQNSLYIADRNNHRIQKYLVGSSTGMTVAGLSNGTSGSSLDRLLNPSHVIVDTSGNMHIADTGNQRILSWLNGASLGTMVAGTGIGGSSNNQLSIPYGIERDLNSGTLYISDYSNSRIMSYLKGASSGTVIAGGNGPETNQTQLMYPVGLYLDSLSNCLIIANHLARNIVRWVIGENHWTLLVGSINGTAGSSATLLSGVTDMTFDPTGNMYVADRNIHRIQLFMSGELNGITIAGVPGISGANATLLKLPWSVKLDSQLNLYVADSSDHRIQKFLRY